MSFALEFGDSLRIHIHSDGAVGVAQQFLHGLDVLMSSPFAFRRVAKVCRKVYQPIFALILAALAARDSALVLTSRTTQLAAAQNDSKEIHHA